MLTGSIIHGSQSFLHQRPRLVIAHSLQRMKRRSTQRQTFKLQIPFKGYFQLNLNREDCTVNFGVNSGSPSCTCEDWVTHHLPCKHFYAILQLKNGWNWDKFPEVYVNSPRLSYDKDVLQCSVPDVPPHTVTVEQVSLLDNEETSVEDSFSSSEPKK